MNPEAERTKRALKFKMSKAAYDRLLQEEEITEAEFKKGIRYLEERYNIDHLTGMALREPPTPPQTKEEVDERHLTYINLTEWAKEHSDKPATVIITWLRSHNTFAFLREWERANNLNFNEAGYQELMVSGNKTITVKLWCEKTGATGIMSRTGNGGGTYAHRLFAADFQMWNDPLFRYTLMDIILGAKNGGKNQDETPPLERKITVIPPTRGV